jgi:quercetin dioxygenase-like cupin family protein
MANPKNPQIDAFVCWAEVEPVEALPGLDRRTLGCSERLLIAEFRAAPGVDVPRHSHPHDQVGYVVSGEVQLTIGDETVRCAPGDSYAIPGGVEHGARFLSQCVVIDCFSPPREDYRRA